jgi:hypothetical protein
VNINQPFVKYKLTESSEYKFNKSNNHYTKCNEDDKLISMKLIGIEKIILF